VIEQDISRSMSRVEVTSLCLGNDLEYWVVFSRVLFLYQFFVLCIWLNIKLFQRIHRCSLNYLFEQGHVVVNVSIFMHII
jgi:hypothetical protein